jgi:mono/diheme cytochrome c family protein
MRILIGLVGLGLWSGGAFGADAGAGRATYDRSCKRCHGAEGAANGAIARMLKVEMRHLGSKEVQGKPDAQLRRESVDGVGKMKAMAVSEAEAGDLVAFLRTLKQ